MATVCAAQRAEYGEGSPADIALVAHAFLFNLWSPGLIPSLYRYVSFGYMHVSELTPVGPSLYIRLGSWNTTVVDMKVRIATLGPRTRII